MTTDEPAPMSHEEQLIALGEQLDSFIERFVLEYDLTPYDIIAALQMKAFLLMQEIADEHKEYE